MAFLAPAAGTALTTGLAKGTMIGAGTAFKAATLPTVVAGTGAAPLAAFTGKAALPTLASKGLAGTGLKALAGTGGQTLIGAGGQTLAGTGVKTLAGTGVKTLAGTGGQTLIGAGGKTLAGAPGVLPSQFSQVAPNLVGREQVLQAFSQAPTKLPELAKVATTDTAGILSKAKVPGSISDAVYKTKSAATTAPKSLYDLSTASNAAQYQSALRPAVTNLVDDAGMAVADPRAEILGRSIRPEQNFLQNLTNIGSFQDVKDYARQHPYASAGIAGLGIMGAKKLFEQDSVPTPESKAMIRPYTYERTQSPEAYAVSPGLDSSERLYFNDRFIAGEPYKAAEGGLMGYAVGGPVEQMAAMNSVGMNTGYPMANLQTPMYSNPAMQRPEAMNVIAPSAGAGVGAYSGEQRFAEGGEAKTTGGYRYSYDPKTMQFTQLSVPMFTPPSPVIPAGAGHGSPTMITSAPAPRPVTNSGSKISGGIATPAMGPTQTQAAPINIPAYRSPEQQLGLGEFYDYMNQQLGGYGGYAAGGGIADLGGYSDGGRLLKGPGDGVSDSIPASIGGRQPARLADGEFVVPARIVSELGNGSTEAGARKLYAMMDRVQRARRKSIGKKKVAVNSRADKHLPA